MKKTTALHVSHRCTRLPGTSFNMFASSVIIGMANNSEYTDPLVPLDELSALQMEFEQKMMASFKGWQATTAAKKEARVALTTALRLQGNYVQCAATCFSALLSSGYSAASQNRAQTELLKPVIQKMLNERSGRITLRVKPIANARNYQVQIQVGDGGWQEAGIFPKARRIEVQNLMPGTVYKIRVRALGGSTDYSDWSPVTSRMSL
jgi:hypothetical protein